MNINNGITTLEAIFTLSSFSIPQYQRAYSWDVEQVSTFLKDIKEQVRALKGDGRKNYFLGTLLLHSKENNKVDIVDGQQRLTTIVIFISAALDMLRDKEFPNNKKIKRNFIYDEDISCQKFCTIKEDNPYFRTGILKLNEGDNTPETTSAKRIEKAFKYFKENVKEEEWAPFLDVIINSKVMVYCVPTPSEATLIFELQNDRGKKLTDLESLKSYLMHLIYLKSNDADKQLEILQTHFAKIFREIETHSNESEGLEIPNEDSILSYHTVGHLKWTKDEWRDPKAFVKEALQLIDDDNICSEILKFAAALSRSYGIFTELFKQVESFSALKELLMLNRMASFWPLIIKTYEKDTDKSKTNFNKVLRLMELYAFRGYGLSSLRSDAGLSKLYTLSRDFNGDFDKLFDDLYDMSYHYDIDKRCKDKIEWESFYKSNKSEAKYILWHYENYLRSQPGKQVEKLSWRHYMHPNDKATSLNIEHIAAQDNPIVNEKVKWDENDMEEHLFSEVALHRLGNLVLDSTSANSSKGKKDFSDKLEDLNKDSTFLSQGELIDWVNKEDNQPPKWSIYAIKKRQEHLKNFILEKWDPKRYHTLSSNYKSEDDEE